MALKKTSPQTLCPIARAEDVVGDRWTVLVLRELFMRNHRYDDIQAQTGGTPQMVATRLKSLEADGMVERRAYNERPPRYEYHLTAKGQAFYSVVLALRAWGKPGASRRKRAWPYITPTSAAGSPQGWGRCANIAVSCCAVTN